MSVVSISDGCRVNPVTGAVDRLPKISPFEGMSEEQKEYEAMKLVGFPSLLQFPGGCHEQDDGDGRCVTGLHW